MKTAPHAKSRKRIVLLCAALIGAALLVRIWHDRNVVGRASISDLEQNAHSHPNDVQAQLDWGAALDSSHRFDEAEGVFRAAATTAPHDARPNDALARLAMERLRPNDALRYMSASLNVNPNNAANWSSLGTMLLKRSPRDAQQAFARAVSLDPKDAFSWLKLGTLESEMHQLEKGLSDLQRAESLNPNDLETEVALGNCAQSEFNMNVAKEAFDKALALSPNEPRALFGSANATLQLDPSPAGLARAGQQLEKVMAAKPTANAYLLRGHWNLLMRRYPDAVSDLNTALKLNPHLAYAHSFLSQAYGAQGQTELAHKESAAFLAARPDSIRQPTVVSPRAPGR